jgi:molybdopterin molybdotransferase
LTELIAPETARGLVLEHARPLAAEPVPIGDAIGRTLAEPLDSIDAVPSFDNSAMDGFAIRAAESSSATSAAPAWLEIAGESRAGSPAAIELGAGQAIRISTGAMIPAGADAVVRVEDTLEEGERVGIRVAVSEGNDSRRAGDDIGAGQRVLERGALIGPAEIGVAASVGATELVCTRRPRVACLSTGDELVEPGKPLGPGQIHNSNSFAVPAQARAAGAEVVAAEIVRDDLGATVEAIRSALEADLVIVTGGVSVGPHDHVKPALAELGVEQVFWGVALRPGKPTWFGVAGDGTPVFGLPGNPVSAMVTFHLFAEPALAMLSGREPQRLFLTATFDASYRKRPGRAHVVRCKLESREDGLHVSPTKAQGSHVLTSMLGAAALAYLEVERGDVSPGDRVRIELL